MPSFQHLKLPLVVAAVVVVAAIGFLLFVRPLSAPGPTTHTYLVSPGFVARAVILERHSERRTRRPTHPFLPHHLEFDSSNGVVDVYVLGFPQGDSRAQVETMLHNSERLAAGEPPAEFVAHQSGERGRIDLHKWRYGRVKFYALIRSDNETEVTLAVHYKP